MKVRMKICVLALVLAFSVVVAPVQAWTGGNDASTQAAAPSWWVSLLDGLASFFGLDEIDGSVCVDPDGRCRETPDTLEIDNSLCIDPNGGCRS